ncbi:MAG TPA: hypothetical protein VKG38_12070 [Solirubrobacteraceae bacterium]|nr:hypothetical protein [Solirubrobacteraceae bacterium]
MSSPLSIGPAGLASHAPTALLNPSEVPAAVREGSPKAKQAYETARGFEEMLLEQVTQSLVQTSGLGGEGEGEGEGAGSSEAGGEGTSSQAGDSMLASLLPHALAEGVMRQGTVGLAGQMMSALDPAAGKPAAGATGGTPA